MNTIKYINLSRQKGKTTKLVNYIKEGRKFYKYQELFRPLKYYDNGERPSIEISEDEYNKVAEYGKTFKENLRVLVVCTSQEKDYIIKNHSLTYQEVETVTTIKSARGYRNRELVFDNFDMYIEALLYREMNKIGNISLFSTGNSEIFSDKFLERFENNE